MSDNRPIIFFDSGVGGLPYLEVALKKLPQERFVYIADRKNYPYGDRTAVHIREIVLSAIAGIITRFNPKLITIACNTASVVALAALRKAFSLPFVGVVPAIKPAAALTKNHRVGVLATQQTLANEYIAQLIHDFAEGCEVVLVAASQLRDMIEERFFSVSDEEKQAVVHRAVEEVKKAQVDAVVLACTHFLHVEDEFRRMLDSSIRLVDSRQGVINQLVRVLSESGLKAEEKQGPDEFFLTGSTSLQEHYKKYSARFKLTFSGVA